jgi:hypothetical protein
MLDVLTVNTEILFTLFMCECLRVVACNMYSRLAQFQFDSASSQEIVNFFLLSEVKRSVGVESSRKVL